MLYPRIKFFFEIITYTKFLLSIITTKIKSRVFKKLITNWHYWNYKFLKKWNCYIYLFFIEPLISIDRIYTKSKTHTHTHTHRQTHASRCIEHYRNIVRITYRDWIANRFKHSHSFEALRQIPFLVGRKQSLILVWVARIDEFPAS